MNQPPPHLSSKEILNQQIIELLEKIISLLNILHTLPFHNAWVQQEPTIIYLQALQQMESFLLGGWNRLKIQGIPELRQSILEWHGRQTRSQTGVLQLYYKFHEQLVRWAAAPEIAKLRMKNTWQDYVIYVLVYEPHLLTCLSTDSAYSEKELQLLASYYLEQMQQLHDHDLYSLCLDFSHFISIFTQESYFLPYLHKIDGEHAHSEIQNASLFQKFREELRCSETWSACAETYLAVLRPI